MEYKPSESIKETLKEMNDLITPSINMLYADKASYGEDGKLYPEVLRVLHCLREFEETLWPIRRM